MGSAIGVHSTRQQQKVLEPHNSTIYFVAYLFSTTNHIYIYIDIVRLKPVRLVEQIELVLASYVGVILIGGFLREWHTERQDNIYFSFDLKHLRPKQSHNLDAQDN